MKNELIYETDNFIVEAFSFPHISREEGGHLKITPKKYYEDRSELPPREAIEVMRLTMITGKAFKRAMNNRGIPVIRVNYHDMGNWAYKKNEKPYFHIHIYGRAENATIQAWPEAMQLPDRSTGFYDNFIPLNREDINEIRKQILIVEEEAKYRNSEWTTVLV
ncbi:MAG: hypothetical protein FWC79_00880 [Oscillospiraceae bacterium]|nr:hypothetical protein [Oscillospiraceae bacterium]